MALLAPNRIARLGRLGRSFCDQQQERIQDDVSLIERLDDGRSLCGVPQGNRLRAVESWISVRCAAPDGSCFTILGIEP